MMPDVVIETLFDKQIPREKSNKTALKTDIIACNLRFDLIQNPKRDFAIESSKKRVLENLNVKAISDLNIEINKLYDNDLPDVILDFNSVFSSVSKMNSIWKNTENLLKKEFPITISRNSVDVEYQQFDEFLLKSNDDKIKAIKCNLHIIEAVNIINDLKN
jgi:carboxyl-terminal processing protease